MKTVVVVLCLSALAVSAQGSFVDWAARAVKDSAEYTVSAEGGFIVLTSPRKDGTLLKLF